MVLGEGIIQRFLTNILSAYFESVDRDNISVAVVRGDISLSNLRLRASVLDHLGFKSVRLVTGTVGSLKAKVPWHRFGTAPIVFELSDLHVLLEAKPDEPISTVASTLAEMTELESSIYESMQEIQGAVLPAAEEAGAGWGGWLRSAGRIAKRLIDHIEVQVKVNNVHIRYSGDTFTAGATLDSLSVVTTTQASAPKVLDMQRLALYCNPLEDAVEDAMEDAVEGAEENVGDDRAYILEPVSGGITLTFSRDEKDGGEVVNISGEFDSVKFQFTKEQLDTSIWAELKHIVIAKAAADPKDLLLRAVSAATAPPVAAATNNSLTRMRISFSLGQAVVRSLCLGAVDFIGDEIRVTGDIAPNESEIKFTMSRLTIIAPTLSSSDPRLLSTNADGIDFIRIGVKASSITEGVDVTFHLGPVAVQFHPLLVASILSFVKSFSDSNPKSAQPAIPADSTEPRLDVISKSAKVRIQFFWVSMDVLWFLPSSSPGGPFAHSSMSTSYISLEVFENHFVARGELGDFSIDHLGGGVARPLLASIGTGGYLFKFFVRSFDPNNDFPGYHTQIEFELDSVRLMVVRSVLMRLWDYVFDAFIPAITGCVAEIKTTTSQSAVDQVVARKVSSASSSVSGGAILTPRKAYLLHVKIASLELELPVSSLVEEPDCLKIELRSLTARNHGAEGEIDQIDFELEEVRMQCMRAPLIEKIRVQTSLFREQPVVRIVTSFDSEIPLKMTRMQFCRLCDVLQCNILAGAWDGVPTPPGQPNPSQQSSKGEEVGIESEWLKFEFVMNRGICLCIDNDFSTTARIESLLLKIVKFTGSKFTIAVTCEGGISAEPHLGSVDSVTVDLESSAEYGRSIQVAVNAPICEVHLGTLINLRQFFFDPYVQYVDLVLSLPRNPAFSTAPASPPTPEGWESVLNVNLSVSKLVFPINESNGDHFSITTNLISYHQSSDGNATQPRLCRKVVVNNACVYSLSDAVALGGSDSLLVGNLDLFCSLMEEDRNELVKFNCEPFEVKVGFSHLKNLAAALSLQKEHLLPSGGAVDAQSEDLTVVAEAMRVKRREIETTFHSASFLVINDFAQLENTPLLHVVMKNVSTQLDISVSLPDQAGEGSAGSVGLSGVKKETFSGSIDLAISYFNKTAVTWEPLIESQASDGKVNDPYVKFLAKRNVMEFFSAAKVESSSGWARERSVQNSFDVGEGIQVNVTEALLRSVTENLRLWALHATTLSLRKPTIQPQPQPQLSPPTSGSPSGSSTTIGDKLFFSPYSVCNMTGDACITVEWRDGGREKFEIPNRAEVPLTGVSVAVSDVHQRVFVKVVGDGWTFPRVPLDRQGTYLFRASAAAGDIIAQVAVSVDGRKVLTLSSSVMVVNEFGSPLVIRMADDSDDEDEGEVVGIGESVPVPLSAVVSGHFRLSSHAGRWSGLVSVSDIRARNDSKLWQITTHGGDQEESFMYLSGAKRVVTFQDRSCEQLLISVFAPVRLKSTIPAMVDYQIATSPSASSSAKSYVASGSIGLNGRECIATVPLTGKLEVAFSMFEGRCVSSTVQIWPIPTRDMELDESCKLYFLPIRLVYPSARSSGAPSLELRLYMASISVKPPELTLHTSLWLVCVDVPPQLRFVYEEGVDVYDTPEVVIPSGERTFVTPLHVGGKKIAAFLNKTRSEPVPIDTIGACSQISIDAVDESTGTRLKQDLAVRVSAVPTGTVRDFPAVKMTTVSPKYVIVNMLRNSTIQVRQYAPHGTTRQTVIGAKPGEQVPFRWWAIDPNSVKRLLQVKTAESEWSLGGISVSEIGESVIQGIDDMRVEIRIFHGGFYVVFSNLVGGGPDDSAPAAQSLVGKSAQGECMSNSVYQLVLPGLSVSLVGPVPSRQQERAEICLVDIKMLLVTLSLTPVANELDLRMQSVQVDDMRDESKFPVVFSKSAPKKRSSSSSAVAESRGAVEVFAAWIPPKDVANETVLVFESFLVRVADSDLMLDYSLVSDLTDLIHTVTAVTAADDPSFPYKFVPSLEVLPVGSLRIWSFRELLLSPMRISLSFSPFVGKSTSANLASSVVNRAIAAMAAVDRSPLKLKALALTKFRASRSNVVSVVTEHYKHELYTEMRTIMGSAEAFGNPIGLLGSVSTGVSDLFNEPLNAIREMQGPEDMINVADKTAKGAKSFFKNTAFGVFNSMSKLAATSAQTLSILTEDEEYLTERSDFNNKNRPTHVGDGMVVGAASFGRGIISGLSGLVTKPVQGMEQDGFAGFAKGTVKGVGGLFLKPVAGFLDFAKSTADGVVSSTRDASADTAQARLPRMLYSHDRSIRVVNPEHSLLRWYLSRIESMPQNMSYGSHVFDTQNGLLVAASSEHFLVVDTIARRLSLLVPLWRVLGVTVDLDHLVLTVTIQTPADRNVSAPPTRIDFELSSALLVKQVQQLVANAMQL